MQHAGWVLAAATNKLYSTYFFFMSDTLWVEKLPEKMEQALLRVSADEAEATEAEPAEKVAHMEAGPSTGSPPSTSKSSFSSLYDRILEQHDEPAGGTQAAVI